MLDLMRRRGLAHLSLRAPATAVVLVLAACGGSGGGPGAPNPPGAPPSAAPAGFTVTISATGASPKELRVPIGSRVTFVNQDSRPHQMMSAPHPLHTDCPAINALGTINSGETRATDAFTVQRACGFHDNLRDGDTTLQGQILVAEAERDPNYGY
jgi:plastocyanin